jgi:Ca2+/Na+ antiporter
MTPLQIWLFDFLLFNSAILGMHLIKRGMNVPSPIYMKLFFSMNVAWLIVSVGMRKFRRITKIPFIEGITLITKSNILIVYLVSFAVVGMHMIPLSRIQTYGACAIFYLLELVTLYVVYSSYKQKNYFQQSEKTSLPEKKVNISYQLIFIDALLLLAAFFTANIIKRGNFSLPLHYDQIFLLLYTLWFFFSVATRKFDRINFSNFYNAFHPCIKTVAFIAVTFAVIVFAFRFFFFSRLQIFGSFAILLFFEAIVFYIYYAYRKYGKISGDIESVERVKAFLEKENVSRTLDDDEIAGVADDPVDEKLRHTLDFFSHRLYKFISENIDLFTIERNETSVISTDNFFNIKVLEDNHLRLLVNLHKTNDVRWFNQYFLEIHSKLKSSGYFIGKAHTITTHRKVFVEKYPGYVANLFYSFSFIWQRVFPKLPVIQKIYFALTKGRNRMVSKAEVLGRLYFCGFKLIAEMEIDNRFFFIAQKVMKPSVSENPTYGPLVKLNRLGYVGNTMEVYKFRTMHPYAEFLQDYIFEKNKLQKGGKFSDDFRVTEWGRFMRSTWIDELPMLYNWLKGDLKFFGVRPLSRQYLSLYPAELQELRARVKPGLIPPFYSDMPDTLEEIIESELHYIKSYLKTPMRTQVTYLWRSFVNIVIKGARSN